VLWGHEIPGSNPGAPTTDPALRQASASIRFARVSRPGACLALTVALVAGGCGSDDKSDSGGAKPVPNGPAPSSLVGTYTTTLTQQDLSKNRAPELSDSPEWELTIANTGGSGSGHALTLTNKTSGGLQAPDFGVSGDRIVLKQEECAAGEVEHFYDNEYRFTQAGKTLRFTTVRNSCPDRVAETIPTSEPWTKQGG
jgi:hypothetical protein